MKPILILLLFFFSCKNIEKSENEVVKETDISNKEAFFDFYKFKLNGVLLFVHKTSECHKILGEPIESIKVDYNESCGLNWENADFETYYKGLKCDSYKDSSCIKHINFEENPNLFVTYDSLQFSIKLSLDDFKLEYPNNESFPVFHVGTAFSISLGQGIDDKIIFIFRNNKLVEFSYYIPC
jgi:hypothetical protein